MKSIAFTKYGEYKICTKEAINRENYRLRFKALLLNNDFLNYCRLFWEAQISGDWQILIDEDFRAYKKRTEIDSILSAVNGNAWTKLSEWLERITPNEINLHTTFQSVIIKNCLTSPDRSRKIPSRGIEEHLLLFFLR
jgi:hypothetical protein